MNKGHPKKAPDRTYCPHCGSCQDRYLSPATAAKVVDMSEEAVRGMIRRREIPFFKLGRRVRLSYADLQAQLVRYPAKHEVSLASDGNHSYHTEPELVS